MGHWSEETATIILPRAAVPSVKRALRESHNSVRADALALAKRIHSQARTTSKRSFDADMTDRFGCGLRDFPWSSDARVTEYDPHRKLSGASRDHAVTEVAHKVLLVAYRRAKRTVPVPTQADADAVLPKATTATTEFPILGKSLEAKVHFEGNIVTWDRVAERAHYAMDSDMARVFWRALDDVTWTRGTGGEVLHQSEHSVEAFAGPSVVRTYGKQAA